MQFLRSHCQMAWEIAIHNCDLIFDGLTDVAQRKIFVSSLQNALELAFKQRLLDQNNKEVLKVNKNNLSSVQQEFLDSKDLNEFFTTLSAEQLDSLRSNSFSQIFKQITKALPNQKELDSSLQELANLRNKETHFYINESNYLTEPQFRDFCSLMQEMQTLLCSFDILDHKWFGVPPESDESNRSLFLHDPSKISFYNDFVLNSSTNKWIVRCFPADEKSPDAWFYAPINDEKYSLAYEIFHHHAFGGAGKKHIDFQMNFDEFYRRFLLMIDEKMVRILTECDEEPDEDGNVYPNSYVYVLRPKDE